MAKIIIASGPVIVEDNKVLLNKHGDTSFWNGVQELVINMLNVISLLFFNQNYDTCEAVLDIFDLAFAMVKISTSIIDGLVANPLGKVYALFTIANALLDLNGILDRLANFASNNVVLKGLSGLAELIQSILPTDEKKIPYWIMLSDACQLFIGEIYIVQL